MEGNIDLLAYARGRFRAHIETKREENEKALGQLRNIESLWDRVNADIEEENQSHFDRMDGEQRAAEHAQNLLRENPCETIDPNAWLIAGKVIDEKSKVGVPGIQVRVLLGAKALDADVSDTWGNFKLKVREGLQENMTLAFEALSDRDTVFHRETRVLTPRAGQIERLIFEVACEDPVQSRLEGGLRARDSVLADSELVERRLENMRESRDLLNRLGNAGLAGLRELAEALTTPPPAGDDPSGGGSDSGDVDDRDGGDVDPGGGSTEPGGGTESEAWVLAARVHDPAGAPLGGFTVILATVPDPDRPFARQVTDDNGAFKVALTHDKLPSDAADGILLFVLDASRTIIGESTRPLFFEPGGTSEISIIAKAPDPEEPRDETWTIQGQVKRPPRLPVANLEVLLMIPGTTDNIVATLTDVNGRYSMTILKNHLRLSPDGVTLGVREKGEKIIFRGRKILQFEPGATIMENITTTA